MRWIRHGLEALGVLLATGFFCVLPRRWAHFVGRRLGWIAYWCSFRSRSVALENLTLILGLEVRAARRVAKECMRQAGAAVADLMRAPRAKRSVMRRAVEVPEATWQAINAIRRGGRGAVFASSHYGNWEFANLTCPFSALPPATVVVRPLSNPIVNRLLTWFRSRTGQKLILRTGAAMECMQRVRDGEICIITFDLAVPPDAGAEAVDFFGLPTYTTVGVGYVAAMTRAPVYLAHFEPIGGSRYRFVLKGPLEAPIQETLRETAVETTRRVSKALEKTIRGHPEGWAWWMKRWRIRPDGIDEGFPSYSVEESWLWPRGTPKRRDR